VTLSSQRSGESVLVALQTAPAAIAAEYLRRVQSLAPHLAFYVIAEFPPETGIWIPFRFDRDDRDNWGRIQAEIGTRRVHLCAQLRAERPLLVERIRRLGWRLAPFRQVYFNEALDHYMVRPRSLKAIAKDIAWRSRSAVRDQLRPGGDLRTLWWRLGHPRAFWRPLLSLAAAQNGWALALNRPRRRNLDLGLVPPPGVSVVIPSRDGKDLLSRCLPLVLSENPDQIIVVDNGSSDGTATWLGERFPAVEVVTSPLPLSFAAAINRGIAVTRFSHVCLLNNDMEIEPGFLAALRSAFDRNPDLFCATAQIFFPEGVRREETGKAAMLGDAPSEGLPLACLEPVEGESDTEVLYGSGGCSLYDARRLHALGGFDELYAPAYVEDLDLGYRGWQSGAASVFVPEARVLHRHRATTSRFFAADAIDLAIERNFLRFLASRVTDPALFSRCWDRERIRLNRWAADPSEPRTPLRALRFAAACAPAGGTVPSGLDDGEVLALGSGEIYRFPGQAHADRPRVVVASCYAPFPLAHGGAVRIYNLMRRASAAYSQTLIYFSAAIAPPPPELLEICEEVIVVRRRGRHQYLHRHLPDAVQDFSSAAFRAALQRTIRLKRPFAVQLEFTQMAQYARDCAPAKTILVEHDVTIDLYRQLAANASGGERWELEHQLPRWEAFEREAWRRVDAVVTMSERDRAGIGDKALVIENGVDLEFFRSRGGAAQPGRLLFIGSFAHLPNLLALDFFLEEIWPSLPGAHLHIIGGRDPEYFLNFYRHRLRGPLHREGVEVEGFVSDVRPAYERAEIVIAPLVASAGTNIKILEAMAMGRAIVSTPAGIHGLDVRPGTDLVLAQSASEFAAAVQRLRADPAARETLARAARDRVVERYGWQTMASRQAELYERLRAAMA
jgi:GT2 family glycosyltransferase/glycosyltransferase involved in cell wall biosynthesis